MTKQSETPSDLVKELRELRAFLDGSAPIDDLWYGDRHPTIAGAFWWRKTYLERLDRAAAELAAAQQELEKQLLISCTVMDERCAAITRAEQAERRADENQKNAERYLYLRDQGVNDCVEWGECLLVYKAASEHYLLPEEIDEAIDRARKR